MEDKKNRNNETNPRTIADFLDGGTDAMNTGERMQDYSPRELLALDEPIYEILNKGQSEMFSKIVYDFFKSENHNAQDWARFLGYFNLDIGAYDEHDNPTGMQSGEIRESNVDYEDDPDLRVSIKTGFLYLCGVKGPLINDFFGASTNFNHHGKDVFSKVFLERLDTVRMVRSEYPLKNPEEFPQIAKALKSITKNLNIEPLEIFANGHIPALFGSGRKNNNKSLYAMLQFVSMASTGQWTKPNLERRLDWVTNTIYQLLNGKTLALSQKTRDALKEKIPKR